MQSKAATVEAYLASLPEDRRAAIGAVREVFLANLGPEFREGMQYGMVGYFLPHEVYPPGYHCDPKQPLPFAGLASQKNHMGMYLFCLYAGGEEEQRFRAAWEKTGKKLDMGKACIRFKKIEDVPLEVVGATVRRMTAKKFIAHYEGAIKGAGSAKKASTKSSSKKVAKKTSSKAAGAKKTAKKTAKKSSKKSATKRAAK
ncbi:MAG: DUF1801 domain-containing protein [Phycisphaerales bacterium]|nr:DUF1801 domain-containing protein [Phycisphaerales bacterium]